MSSKITIGITGGIGSGKSIVCRIVGTMGYPVFYSDDQAKSILSNDKEVIEQVQLLIGKHAYLDGELNRPLLASKIFDDDAIRESINSIIHPKVQKAFKDWTSQQEQNIVFNEAAILFETGSYKNFNHIILVTSPSELRIKRIMKRDSIRREEVLKRMSKQWLDKDKIPLADFIVVNDDEDMIMPQVLAVLKKFNHLYEDLRFI